MRKPLPKDVIVNRLKHLKHERLSVIKIYEKRTKKHTNNMTLNKLWKCIFKIESAINWIEETPYITFKNHNIGYGKVCSKFGFKGN